jgi:hypothetical protein
MQWDISLDHAPCQVQERAQMREITALGVAEEAGFAKRAMEHADKLREERKKEKEEKAKKKQLTFKEKEKRKRNAGKQSSGIFLHKFSQSSQTCVQSPWPELHTCTAYASLGCRQH